jgi:hypothetical protein
MVLVFVLPVVVALVVAFAIIFILSRRWSKSPPTMRATFDVGESEIHTVNVTFTQPTTRIVVETDGLQVANQTFATGLKLTRSMEFEVGEEERHVVRIEKRRSRLNANFRPQHFFVYIDGMFFEQFESQFSRRED